MYSHAALEYPKIMLQNSELQVSIYLPDADHGYYRGTRFDWSGIIERIEYRGHRFYAPLHAAHDPLGQDSVSGPAEEFAMFHPMGYDEAKPGESFVKIGVGLLERKDDSKYEFYGDYRLIRAGEWQIDTEAGQVDFRQSFQGERGWAYDYEKTIRLVPGAPEMVIEHRLKNNSRKAFSIVNYNHNFTMIDDTPYGPDYEVEFPFSTDEPISINNLAWFRGNAIEVDEALQQESLWIPVFQGEDPGYYNAALVRNRLSGAAVEFIGDASIERMVFWAVERAACPEPFIRLKLAPGESTQWSTRYRYSAAAE